MSDKPSPVSYYAALEAEHDRAYANALRQLQRPAEPLDHDIPSDLIERLERYEVERRRHPLSPTDDPRSPRYIRRAYVEPAPRGFRPPSAAFEHKRECR